MGADQAFVIQVAQDLSTWTKTHNWHNPDTPIHARNYQQIPMGAFAWREQLLREGRTIQIHTTDDLPPEADFQHRTYEEEGVKSILNVPLRGRGKRVLGLMGFQSYLRRIHWSQEIVQWAQMVGDAIANILERRKTEEALAEREKRYQLLFDLSPSGILLEDSAANILEANPAMCRIFGYSHDELCGRNVRMLAPPERHSEIERHLDDLLAGKTLFHEIENVGKDGQRLRVEIHEMSVPLSDGRRGILAVVNDITERRQLEEQLRHLQKMELVGQLAAGVSHDFNNILTVINGSSSILIGLLKDSPECMEWVTQILAAGERAANLTRQLLLFSRKQQMQPQIVDLNELTSNLTKMLARVLGEDITLQFSYETDLPAVHVDPGMLEQVIINLAVNARDAMPHGGRLHIGTSTVSFTSAPPSLNPEAQPGRFVRVSVLDTGSGIPPEVRERIFEPFFTTKEVGKGTGLGLATVFGIVTQHRGWIEVDSTVGQGTTFHIYLPACASSEPQISDRTALPSESGCGQTILLVEDDESVRELIFRSLTRQGYTVMTAGSGAAAQRLPHEQLEQVDLLVSDMVMPGGVSGRDLAEFLRRTYPRLRVIYLSGYSPEIMGGWLSLEHGVAFIQKPVTPQELLKSVAECLQA
jgi:PAS domain S-box-containing protein